MDDDIAADIAALMPGGVAEHVDPDAEWRAIRYGAQPVAEVVNLADWRAERGTYPDLSA